MPTQSQHRDSDLPGFVVVKRLDAPHPEESFTRYRPLAPGDGVGGPAGGPGRLRGAGRTGAAEAERGRLHQAQRSRRAALHPHPARGRPGGDRVLARCRGTKRLSVRERDPGELHEDRLRGERLREDLQGDRRDTDLPRRGEDGDLPVSREEVRRGRGPRGLRPDDLPDAAGRRREAGPRAETRTSTSACPS